MPKIKIKNWKGLYTNIDENDQSLDIARASINWRHNRGFLEFENRDLGTYALPDIDTAFAGYNWTWETGIYTTLTNDPLDTYGTAAKYDCLILVAKTEDNGIYHRLIYLKDLNDSNATPATNGWYELSKNGNASPFINILNHDGAGGFTGSYFSTTLDGQAYFREESGHIKLFLPHSCFWIGKLERTVVEPNNGFYQYSGVYLGWVSWYIDKLVDTFDATVAASTTVTYPHRLAWTGGVTTSTDNVQRNKEVSMGAFELLSDVTIEDGHPDKTYAIKYAGNFVDGGAPIPTTVVPFAPSEYPRFTNSFFLYLSGAELNKYVFSYDFYTYYEPYDPVTDLPRDLVAEGIAIYEPDMKIAEVNGPSTYTLTGRQAHRLTQANFESISWRYRGTLDTATDGFDDTETEFHLIVTAVLDEREEIIVKALTKAVDESAKWKIVISDAGLTTDSNKRATRLRYYVKLGSQEIYYLYKDIEFLATTNGYTTETANFDIIEGDNTAITLSQNIGIEPDEERWMNYTIIEGFRDIRTESGVSIGISNKDYSNVYYSVLGGGNLQPDLMYTQNILQVAGANVVNAVAVVNKDLAVLTDDTMYIVRVVDDVGALVFTINQALEFGVKDQFDIAQIQGGLAINTRHGIYTTTGTQSNLISEAIDDVVKSSFATSRIYYNKDLHELYFKRTIEDNLYRFRFKDSVWEVINKL